MKYYTPTPEEFVIGAEYEYRPESDHFERYDWQKRLYDPRDFMSVYAYDDWDFELDDDLLSGRIRMRYLNAEDIESCGFHKHPYREILANGYFKDLCCYKSNGIYVFLDSVVRIDKKEKNGFPHTVFNGTIKNLRELKMILKMIGYEN